MNGFTGETFTLTPLSSNRTSHFSNVVGHMVTESAIQGAWRRSDPSAFNSASLEHRIPQDFVLRTYFDVDSPVWQRMARDPMSRWEAARTADPRGARLKSRTYSAMRISIRGCLSRKLSRSLSQRASGRF